jgi:hypothetical protein
MTVREWYDDDDDDDFYIDDDRTSSSLVSDEKMNAKMMSKLLLAIEIRNKWNA